MEGDGIRVVQSSRFRKEFTDAWREVYETSGALCVTYQDFPEFVIFPVAQEIRYSHGPLLSMIARQVYQAATGLKVPKGYEERLPPISPERMRRGLGGERRRIRSLMVPFFFTYFGKVQGILFPIPHDGGMETITALKNAWYGSDVSKI